MMKHPLGSVHHRASHAATTGGCLHVAVSRGLGGGSTNGGALALGAASGGADGTLSAVASGGWGVDAGGSVDEQHHTMVAKAPAKRPSSVPGFMSVSYRALECHEVNPLQSAVERGSGKLHSSVLADIGPLDHTRTGAIRATTPAVANEPHPRRVVDRSRSVPLVHAPEEREPVVLRGAVFFDAVPAAIPLPRDGCPGCDLERRSRTWDVLAGGG